MIPYGIIKEGDMTNQDIHTQAAFRALADPTRRQILKHLSEEELPIGDLVDRFDITRAAVKKHLTILEEGNLISVHAQGRERINRLEPQNLRAVTDWLDYFSRFWDGKLGKLKQAIENDQENSK
jgi:DNA-binding transcriptional ArsR family regulator